jgi:hypothetical protein
MLIGEVLYALFVNINGAEDFRVFRLQTFEKVAEALADLFLNFRVLKSRGWLRRCLQFACPCCKSFLFGNVASIVINDCIPKQTVEPGHCRLVWLEVVVALKGAEICSLEDVFGELVVRNTAMNEGKESLALGDELVERSFCHRNSGIETEYRNLGRRFVASCPH